jgi:hypothetical protein
MSPNMDARIDVTDIYAFQAPDDASRSALVLSVNPLAPTLATAFSHDARYELRIDTNDDAIADIVYRIRFSDPAKGPQTATVRRLTGDAAAGNDDQADDPDGDDDQHDDENEDGDDDGARDRVIVKRAPVDLAKTASPHVTERRGYKFFAGIRSDSFFFDLAAFLGLPPHAHALDFTNPGSDFFLDKNVFSIVISAPKVQLLGAKPKVGYWARCLVRVGGRWVQKDRMGRPAINTVFNHGEDKNTFNNIPPTRDRTLFKDKFIAVLEGPPFNRDAATATALTAVLLPDLLTYDYSNAAGFLNGRKLQDDVIDAELQLLTGSGTISDFVGPHGDYLAVFPYLGTPH